MILGVKLTLMVVYILDMSYSNMAAETDLHREKLYFLTVQPYK